MGVNEIQTILTLLDKHGISLVLIAIFLAAIVTQIVTNHKRTKNEEERLTLQRELADQQQQNIQQLMLDVVRQKLGANHAQDDAENNEFNREVNTIMTLGLKDALAQRVVFFRYHNGGVDYSGRSFQKMSCTNEIVQLGVKPIQDRYSGVFRNTMHYLYEALNKNNFFNIENIEDIKTSDPGFYELSIQENISSTFGAGVTNKNGDTIGFIAFCYEKPFEGDREELVRTIKRTKYKIEGLYHMI